MPKTHEFLALYDKGAYQEAYAVLRDIIATQSPQSQIGDAYVMCAELELIINDDISKARDFLDTALRRGCQDMDTYYRCRGYVLWRAGEIESGMRDMEKSVALNPTITNLTTLGKALSYAGDRRAAEIWERVVREQPQNCKAYVYLGMLAAKTGDKGKALLMAEEAERHESTVNDLVEIGSLYAEAGDLRKALDKYFEAERRGDHAKAPLYAGIAMCCFGLGNVREGCTYLERARRCNPDHVDVKRMWNDYHDKPVGKAD